MDDPSSPTHEPAASDPRLLGATPAFEPLTPPLPHGSVPSPPASSNIPIAPARSQRLLVATGVMIALALSSLAFVLGRLSVSEPMSPTPVSATSEVAPVEASSSTSTTVVSQVEPPAPVTSLDMDGLEPVAAIARAVGPAVVQIETSFGVGSGVIYDSSGLILTAAHVVEGVTEVIVRFSNGTAIEGTVVGTHEPTDVAVVSIPGSPDLPTAVLAIGIDPSIGSLAVALGSPFGLDQTVTAGVVSAVRTIGGVGMVQTDAAINPGNSGGPLVDRLGRVIGINDQILTRSGASQGVGFAIAIDIAVLVADQLVAGEEVRLARLGVSSTTMTDGVAGALVQEVVEDSAAAAAGLQIGDLIVAIGGRPIRSSGDLRAEIISLSPGTPVTLTVVRDGVEITVRAVLGSATF